LVSRFRIFSRIVRHGRQPVGVFKIEAQKSGFPVFIKQGLLIFAGSTTSAPGASSLSKGLFRAFLVGMALTQLVRSGLPRGLYDCLYPHPVPGQAGATCDAAVDALHREFPGFDRTRSRGRSWQGPVLSHVEALQLACRDGIRQSLPFAVNLPNTKSEKIFFSLASFWGRVVQP